MDESGVSPREPLLVQAAIIVHGDEQLISVEDRLICLVEKHIPEHQRDRFIFHATDIYGGGGKGSIFSDKNEWPDERRWKILDDLLGIPKAFNLPICVGMVDKDGFKKENDIDAHKQIEVTVAMHALSIVQCEIGIELWMRANTYNEITHIIAENNDDVRVAAKEAHILLKDKNRLKEEGIGYDHPCFPFVKIRDGLHFATKEESKILQLADACAWSLRRIARRSPNSGRFYAPIHEMIWRPSSSVASDLGKAASQ